MEPTQEEREAPEIQRQEDPSVPEPRSGRKKKERKKKTGERDREMEEENLPVPLEEKRDSGGERRGGWGLL